MSNGAVVTFAPSIFERDHLFVFKLVQDLAGNFGSLDKWRSGGEAVAIPVQNHFVKCDLVAGGCRELFDPTVSPGLTRYCLPPERMIAYAMVTFQERRRTFHKR